MTTSPAILVSIPCLMHLVADAQRMAFSKNVTSAGCSSLLSLMGRRTGLGKPGCPGSGSIAT
eukprot:3064593-Prorocentrum_lima.AAC.1